MLVVLNVVLISPLISIPLFNHWYEVIEAVLEATPVKTVVLPAQLALYPFIETDGKGFTSTLAGHDVNKLVVPLFVLLTITW